jgi:hypothetical protein
MKMFDAFNAQAPSFNVHNAHSIKKEHRKHERRMKGFM